MTGDVERDQAALEVAVVPEGPADERVPVALAARMLNNLQLLLWQLGEYLLGQRIKERGAYSVEVLGQCRLEFEDAKVGSYHARVVLPRVIQPSLYEDEPLGQKALKALLRILTAVNAVQHRDLARELRDPAVRRRILQYVDSMLPRDGERFKIQISHPDVGTLHFTRETHKLLAVWMEEDIEGEVDLLGQLVQLHIEPNRTLAIRSLDDHELIKATYEEGLEPTLIANMGAIVRVMGKFIKAGRNKKIIHVSAVENPAVEYINLDGVKFRNRELRFVFPLKVVKTEEAGLIVLRIPELWVHEFGATLPEAMEALQEELLFLWDEYALAADGELSEDARRLKRRLNRLVSGICEERHKA